MSYAVRGENGHEKKNNTAWQAVRTIRKLRSAPSVQGLDAPAATGATTLSISHSSPASCITAISFFFFVLQPSSSSSLPLSQPSSYSSQILTRPSQSASRSSIPTMFLAPLSIDRTFRATDDEVDREAWTASVLGLEAKSKIPGKLSSEGYNRGLW